MNPTYNSRHNTVVDQSIERQPLETCRPGADVQLLTTGPVGICPRYDPSDCSVQTYTVQELAHAKGVPSMVTSAMLALESKLSEALDKLHVLESITKRMALDTECVLLNPTGWSAQAQASLQAYRDLMDQWYPQDHVSPLGKD